MRILYGVQGTGNGHLSRARAMATAFQHSQLQVDYLFSGRPADRFFDMDCFGDYRVLRGLTFVNVDGRLDYWRTVRENDYVRFVRDVFALKLDDYDYVISDFEPICSWAGLLRCKTVISMGHQPAFDHPIPVADRDLRSALVMKLFAPGSVRVGMHWDRFDGPLLPPLLYKGGGPTAQVDRKVLVYLPFESQHRVQELLSQLTDYEFYIYAPGSEHCTRGNLQLRPTSLQGFHADLQDCAAVICNAGFELASECLSLGKRLLVKPMSRQMEQCSNALALRELGYGATMDELDQHRIIEWLRDKAPGLHFEFPDVAAAITRWLEKGDFRDQTLDKLSLELWREVRIKTQAAQG